MIETNKKYYLGDSVYMSFDGFQVRLTVEYGDNDPKCELFLDDQVMSNLIVLYKKALEGETA